MEDIGKLAIQITLNDLASAGAAPIGVLLTILLPEDTTEAGLKEIMAQVEEACQAADVQVMGGHTEVTAAVNQAIITVCGVGKVKDGKSHIYGRRKSGNGYSRDKVDRDRGNVDHRKGAGGEAAPAVFRAVYRKRKGIGQLSCPCSRRRDCRPVRCLRCTM